MHPCRDCGKPVETSAQFCPWCFALPGTAEESHARPVAVSTERAVERPAESAVAVVAPPAPTPVAASTATWVGAPVPASPWPRVLLVAGIAALVVGLVVGVLAFRDGGNDNDDASPAAALLRLDDLGAGWAADGDGSTRRLSAEDRELADCLGTPVGRLVATASSPSFTRDEVSMGAQVRRWADAAAARSEVTQLGAPTFAACAGAVAEDLPATGQMVVEGPAPLPGVPGAERLRMNYRFTVEGVGDEGIWIDFVSAARGSTSVSLFAIASFTRPADDVEARAMQAMLGRL